ncbi:hypothetical protein ACIQ9Q_40470 [Streptomyces sp. NPDC094438]|uniref:hypothetical protein n=1 Tax=Streptomyces sp. NPDC094438 TaxID=3366061 RepID=UPI00380369B3
MAGPSPSTPRPLSDPAQARHDLEPHLGWDELPVLFCQSTPQNAPELINGLHSQDGIRGALLDQGTLGPHGVFNFSSAHTRPEPYGGGLLLADGRQAVAVAADGTVTAAVIATSEMLGWGMEQRFSQLRTLITGWGAGRVPTTSPWCARPDDAAPAAARHRGRWSGGTLVDCSSIWHGASHDH